MLGRAVVSPFSQIPDPFFGTDLDAFAVTDAFVIQKTIKSKKQYLIGSHIPRKAPAVTYAVTVIFRRQAVQGESFWM